mmetsp:Transcript_16130/g.31172  ORF Transcript_16130/g.31172 Transcript_16130/m.31172 type:complete len:84 (+) Transcript_16130:2359-2610(+)
MKTTVTVSRHRTLRGWNVYPISSCARLAPVIQGAPKKALYFDFSHGDDRKNTRTTMKASMKLQTPLVSASATIATASEVEGST